MKKSIFVTLVLSFLLSSCSSISEEDIAGLTYSSGYYYVQFQKNNDMTIYQKSSPSSYARGCTADGIYEVKDGKLVITILQSYCASESYSWVSGSYDLSFDKITKGNTGFYR